MGRNNLKNISLLLLLFFAACNLKAQVQDILPTTDVIVGIDGGITYGKVLEVDDERIKYRKNDIPDGPTITLQAKQVYLIVYSNNTTQLITPAFGTQKAGEPTTEKQSSKKKSNTKPVIEEQQPVSNSTDSTVKADTIANFKTNLAHGALKIGLGFQRDYSSFKGIEDFTKTPSAPSLFAAYQCRYNRFLTLGINFGYASFNYSYSASSDYDMIDISQDITEKIGTVGFYGRYDLMDRFFKPYLVLGLNINHSSATVVGDIYFRDEGKHVLINSDINGFKTNFVARAGIDVMISQRFGLYSDIGTGTNLIQVGVVFSFK